MPTHKWHFEISNAARKELKKLSAADRAAIFNAIRELLIAENPLAITGVKKLVASDNQWRKRQGVYRIIFTIVSGQIVIQKFTYKGTVQILEIGHRSSIYD